jgi:hypothetical protein
VRERRLDIDPVRVVEPGRGVRDSDDERTILGEKLREVGTDVAETLDGSGDSLKRDLALARGLADAVQGAAGGRLLPPERAADRQRLSRHDPEHGVALVHGIRVEDPRHHAAVRADVRCGDVLLRPDLVDDLRGEAARHPLQLALGHLLRVADDTALGPAERNA